MRKYDDFNLTKEEWDEIFIYPKHFEPGDIVENSSAGGSEEGGNNVWEVVEASYTLINDDIVYLLKHLRNHKLGRASSTFILPIGTFIDDKPYKKD